MAECADQTTRKGSKLLDFTLVRTAKNRVLRPIRVSSQQTECHLKAGRCGRLRGQPTHPLRQTCCGLCHPQRDRYGLCDLHMLIMYTGCAIILEHKHLCACFEYSRQFSAEKLRAKLSHCLWRVANLDRASANSRDMEGCKETSDSLSRRLI